MTLKEGKSKTTENIFWKNGDYVFFFLGGTTKYFNP